tara:strand:- start:324 stop:668 length:345 start_codon:yes stop_codon:yes gene_type:complete
MGNTQSPTKKRRVTFHPGVKMDRFEEETWRFNHIMRLHSTVLSDDMEGKDKLALLIIKYLERCHGDTNMQNEDIHNNRVITVCIIGLETFQGTITLQQVHALQKCLLEYCVVVM